MDEYHSKGKFNTFSHWLIIFSFFCYSIRIVYGSINCTVNYLMQCRHVCRLGPSVVIISGCSQLFPRLLLRHLIVCRRRRGRPGGAIRRRLGCQFVSVCAIACCSFGCAPVLRLLSLLLILLLLILLLLCSRGRASRALNAPKANGCSEMLHMEGTL